MEIVSFEIAKKLKEKGFNEVCYDYYEPLKHCLNQIKTPWTNKEGESYGVITAPTISQVLKWLREEKKIYVSVEVEREDWFEYKIVQTIKNTRSTGTRVYETYPEAILAGIEYVIDNLI